MSVPAEIRDARERVEFAYDAKLLSVFGHRLIDLVADHLAKAQASQGRCCRGAIRPRMCGRPPPFSMRPSDRPRAATPWPIASPGWCETMLDRGHNLHDPRYIGHQVAASVPLAGLFDAVGSVTNQVMATYDMGPWATAAEWAMVEQLGEQIGWRPASSPGWRPTAARWRT